MKKKITYEQFLHLGDIWGYGYDRAVEDWVDEKEPSFDYMINSALNYLNNQGVKDDFGLDSLENIVVALMNPVSRDIVKDAYVEQEPEFQFILKHSPNDKNTLYQLYKNTKTGIILIPWNSQDGDFSLVKKSEVLKWGYDLSKFKVVERNNYEQ